VTKTHAAVDIDTVIIRPAMRNHVAHAFQHARIDLTAGPS
jgi:hypothetical protein